MMHEQALVGRTGFPPLMVPARRVGPLSTPAESLRVDAPGLA